MGAFENQCSEMSKADLIDTLGRTLDIKRELLTLLERARPFVKDAGFEPLLADIDEALAKSRGTNT